MPKLNMMTNETKILVGLGVATLLIFIGGAFMLSKSTQPQQATVVSAEVLVPENSHKVATESATVTLVEFGDFQCPACAGVHPILQQVLSEYAGRLNFVFRNYPLPQHKNAIVAAQAAEAAGAQGKYWEMHDALYEHQSDWSESPKALEIFATYAKDMGLDVEKFKSEVTAKKYTSIIDRDQADGNLSGVDATPTFFLNGKKMMDLSSMANFKARIDAALAE